MNEIITAPQNTNPQNFEKKIRSIQKLLEIKIPYFKAYGYAHTFTGSKNSIYSIAVASDTEGNILFRENIAIGAGIEDRTQVRPTGDHKKISKKVSTEKFLKTLNKWLMTLNASRSDGRGTIYLVTDGENTKIGATTYNTQKRLNELQTGNAKRLMIVGSYEVENKLSSERALHQEYQDKNILGEWFKLDSSDINRILAEKPYVTKNSLYMEVGENDDWLFESIGVANFEVNKHITRVRKSILRKATKLIRSAKKEQKAFNVNGYMEDAYGASLSED